MSKTTAAVSSECTLLISDQNNGGLQLATNLQLYNHVLQVFYSCIHRMQLCLMIFAAALAKMAYNGQCNPIRK